MKITANENKQILSGNTCNFTKRLTVLVGGNGSGKLSLRELYSKIIIMCDRYNSDIPKGINEKLNIKDSVWT